MPQRIYCERCGTVLYEGTDLVPPGEIVQRYDGRCPRCGKRLSFIPITVKVTKIK